MEDILAYKKSVLFLIVNISMDMQLEKKKKKMYKGWREEFFL